MLVSSYDFYPYYPVTEHVTSWIEQNGTTQLFEKWQKSFVSFFAKDEFSMKSASLIGSGFLYLLDGKHPCIVTAAHVVHELLKSALPFFSINGDKYIFHKLTRCSTLTSYNVGLLKPVALTFTLFKIGKNTQRVRKQFSGNSITQMPQIPCPALLDSKLSGELTNHGFN